MKKAFTLFCFAAFCAVLSAQDIIVTAKAERIEALITEVSPTEIRYKKWNYQDGPTFVVAVADLSAVIFKNGEVRLFNQKPSAPAAQQTPAARPAPAAASATQKTPYNPSAAVATANEPASGGERRYITDTRFHGYLYGGAVFGSGTAGPAFDASLGVRVRDFFYIGFQTGAHVLITEIGKLFYTPLAVNMKTYIPTKKYVYPHFDCAIGGMAGAGMAQVDGTEIANSFGGFYCSAGLGIDAKRFSAGVGYAGIANSGGFGNLGYVKVGVRMGRM